MRFYTRQNCVDDNNNDNDSDNIEDTAENTYRRNARSENNEASTDYTSYYGQQAGWSTPQCPPPYQCYPQMYMLYPCPPPCPPKPCPPKPCPPKPTRRADGAIIPFSSGNSLVTLTTVGNGLPATGYLAAIGCCDTQNGILLGTGGELNLSSGNMAVSLPRNGTITSITAYFTNTIPLTLGSTVIQISAQLYYSATPNNVFLPLAGTRVNLSPTLTGNLAADGIFTGTERNLDVRVSRGTRLILVFFLSTTGLPSVNTTLTGYANAGVNIA